MKKIIVGILVLLLLLESGMGFNVLAATPPTAKAGSLSSKGYLWPITGKIFARGFRDGHYGVDITAATGTAVKSTAAGTVKCSSMASASPSAVCSTCGFGGAGYHVVVRHADGISAIYGHLSKTSVSKGSTVTAGQKIGEVGSTGIATGSHLHFALFKGGIANADALDPMVYTSPFSDVYASDITNTSATLYGVLGNAGMSMVSGGFYIGTSTDNMTKITETMNTEGYINGVAITTILYGTSKWYRTLQPGTTYYYRMWVNYYGKEYVSVIKSFTTTGGHTHTWDSGTITTAPTCDTQGERTYTCSGCTNTKTESVAALGHSYEALFDWSQDHKSCLAVLICSRQCVSRITLEAEVTHDTSDSAYTVHTATVSHGQSGFVDAFTCDTHADGFRVSASITSFGATDDPVTLCLKRGDTKIATLLSQDGICQFDGIGQGEYTLTVSKDNHVPRVYPATVTDGTLELDVKIHLIGDIDGNGKINVGDVAKLYSHIRKTSAITDEYQLQCANVNNGTLSVGDVAGIYSHTKGTKQLF